MCGTYLRALAAVCTFLPVNMRKVIRNRNGSGLTVLFTLFVSYTSVLAKLSCISTLVLA